MEPRKGTLSVMKAFQKKMEEILKAEHDEDQRKVLKKALERGLQALEGRER